MTKSNLPYGCIVEFKDGEKWLRIGNSDALISRLDDDFGEWEAWNSLEDYSENLTYVGDEEIADEINGDYDIVKVYKYINRSEYRYTQFLEGNDYEYELLWEKEESEDEEVNNIKRRLDELTEMIDELRNEIKNV